MNGGRGSVAKVSDFFLQKNANLKNMRAWGEDGLGK